MLINRVLKDAIVIPQRATFENLAKQYVYVVNKDDVVHQREISHRPRTGRHLRHRGGLSVNDKIVLEGIRQVRDGEKVEYEFLVHPQAPRTEKPCGIGHGEPKRIGGTPE